ncbi:MAG: hypothetical protein ACLFVT_02590 [Syntrophobacteria bacterium]
MDHRLSAAGGLTGAFMGLVAELTLEELTGMDLVNGLLSLIGAGFGLIRIDRRIYEATVNLLNRVPVEPTSDYREVLDQIDAMTLDLPELRESFVKLVQAGIRAQQA